MIDDVPTRLRGDERWATRRWTSPLLVRHTEEGLDLVDCGGCVIAPACGLTGVLGEALAAFMAVLDRYTLEDLLARRVDMLALFPPRAA